MIKTIDKVLNPLVFQILILLATVLTLMPTIHTAYGGYVKLVLVFGVLVCIFELFSKKLNGVIKDKASIAALCFALFFLVSIVLNIHNCFESNVKQLLYMIVFFLLLFYQREGNIKLNMKVVSSLIVVSTFVVSLISIIFAFTNREALFNMNTAGAISVISLFLSFYLMFGNEIKKKSTRILSIVLLSINAVLQYFAILVSESRAAYFATIIVAGIIVFVATLKNFKREKLTATKRAVIAFVLCAVTIVTVFSVSSLASKTIGKAIEKNKVPIMLCVNNAQLLSANSNYVVTDDVDINNVTDSNGRIRFWRAGIKAFVERPYFGWTREGSIPVIIDIYGKSKTDAIIYGGLHNIYLTILCSSGIVGFVCFVAIVVIVLYRFLKNLFQKKSVSMELLFSFAISIYFLITELVESRILYTVSFFNVTFWLFFGLLNYFSLKGIEICEEKS